MHIFFIDTETTEVTELSFITLNRFTNLDAIEVYQQLCKIHVNLKHTLCLLSCPRNVHRPKKIYSVFIQ